MVELPAKVIQISAGDSHTAALLEDGRVFAWGTFRVSYYFENLTNILKYCISVWFLIKKESILFIKKKIM